MRWTAIRWTRPISHRNQSSVECVARGQRNFRFALRSPDGAISGQKRVFWAVFGVFRLPDKQDVPGNQEATNQRPSLAQAWPLYIYTTERTEGCHFWSKKGGFSAPKQAGRPGEGRKTRGRPLRAAYETVPRCSIWYGANDLIKVPRLSNIPHHIFDTTYCTSHLAPHIWHLIFGTSLRHLTSTPHI